MPAFYSLDTVLLLMTGFFGFWEVYALIEARGKIRVAAKPFGKTIVTVLLAFLCGLMLYLRRDMLELVWVHAGAIAVCLVLYIFLKAGLGDNGIFYIGRYIPYEKIRHYSIEREEEKVFSLRFTKGMKDFMLDFPIESKEAVVAVMLKHSIADFKNMPVDGRNKK